jgi:hypothetical protein
MQQSPVWKRSAIALPIAADIVLCHASRVIDRRMVYDKMILIKEGLYADIEVML